MNPELKTLIEESLAYAVAQGADAADAAVSVENGFSVSARKGVLEEIEYHQEQGFAITVYRDSRTASVNTTELSNDAVKKIIDKAMSIIRYTDKDPYAGLADKDRLAFNYPKLDLCHDWTITPQQAGQLAVECELIAREYDTRITDSEGASVSTYSNSRVYGNTHGFIGGYPVSYHSISCGVVAKDDNDMQRDSEYTANHNPHKLDDVATVALGAARKTIARLQPRQIKTQKAPVIFHVSEAKSLLGAFINAISGGALYRKSSFLVDSLGQTLFPDHISIYQDPHLPDAMGSRPYDHEGVRTQKQDYVRDGVLQSYALGSYSARRLGMQTTGNAGGVFNLCVTHSDKNLAELLKEMGTGLLVTELIGQGVRIMTGDYSRGAFGFWVEQGEIQYPVHEITIAGNLRDMFQQIVAVGNDIDTRGNVRTGSIWLERMMIAGG